MPRLERRKRKIALIMGHLLDKLALGPLEGTEARKVVSYRKAEV
jgi:hypothetical protein